MKISRRVSRFIIGSILCSFLLLQIGQEIVSAQIRNLTGVAGEKCIPHGGLHKARMQINWSGIHKTAICENDLEIVL